MKKQIITNQFTDKELEKKQEELEKLLKKIIDLIKNYLNH
ncbi:hypothetical protein CWATWH0401_2909 [Crocosphaera watsonii WH 0401]|uniref:Uncharacterized protein n=1 Tax=Crocosphaera watsonii WH 0401 TaxID=555881 RepID=T2J8C8_CROWT|nr:hypothetical protein CWATWH0401_2909 [Crocosphaera watsonii WH 0401]